MAAESYHIAPEPLEQFAQRIFMAVGMPSQDAAIEAASLVKANLRGIDSHGVARIPIYVKRLKSGLAKARPNILVERVSPVAAKVDGDDGMGPVVGTRAMAEAIAMARQSGIAVVGVRRSTHYGMAAFYVLQALEADLISFAFSNASQGMPAWGSRVPFFGTNPFAVGVPGGHKHVPYLLDMATSVIARGKIRLAAERGEAIPEGYALDKHGRPTTDARASMEGVVLPFGGYKGSGIAMLMDLLGGAFTGAAFAGLVKHQYHDWDAPQNVGHFFLAMRPDLFMSMDEFKTRMDIFVERLKACERAEGVEEILVPGEPEIRKEAARRRIGVPIKANVLEQLKRQAAELGVPFVEAFERPLA